MPGAVCTVILAFIVLIFAIVKLNVLIERTEYDVIIESFEYNFDQNNQFGLDDGFAIAAAITAYDSNESSIEDDRIGTIQFYLKHWTGTQIFGFSRLKQRPCTTQDFGTDETSQYGFYPLNKKMAGFTHFERKMKCIDEPFQIWGDYNSDDG